MQPGQRRRCSLARLQPLAWEAGDLFHEQRNLERACPRGRVARDDDGLRLPRRIEPSRDLPDGAGHHLRHGVEELCERAIPVFEAREQCQARQ